MKVQFQGADGKEHILEFPDGTPQSEVEAGIDQFNKSLGVPGSSAAPQGDARLNVLGAEGVPGTTTPPEPSPTTTPGPQPNLATFQPSREITDVVGQLKDAAAKIEGFFNRQPITRDGQVLPEVGSREFGKAAGLDLTDQFGITASFIAEPDPQKRAEIIQNAVPTAATSVDPVGNVIVQLQDGQQFIVNQPGPSTQDIAETAGLLAKIIVIGRFGAGKTIPGTAARSGAATGGVVAGEEIGSAVARGQPPLNIDPTNIGLATGFGGLFGGAGAAIFKALRGMALKNAFVKKDGTITARGQRVIRDAGFDPESMTPATARELDKILRQAQDPAAAIREAQGRGLNVELTTAQRTKRGQGLEDAAAKTPELSPANTRVSRFKEEVQPAQLQTSARTEGRRLFGKETDFQLGANLQRTRQRILEKKLKFKDVVDRAWDRVRTSKAEFDQNKIRGFADDFASIKKDFPEVNIPRIETEIRNIFGSNKPVPLSEVERARRLINNMAGRAERETPIGALQGKLQKALDDRLEALKPADFVVGSKKDVQALFRARGLSRQFKELFKDNKTLAKIIDERNGEFILTPEEAVNALRGAGLGKTGTAKTVQNIKAIVGENSKEFNALKAEFFIRLFRSGKVNALKTGKVSGTALGRNIDDLLDNNPTLAKELFTTKEINAIQTLRRVAEDVTKISKTADVNFSNTGVFGTALKAFAPAFVRELGSRFPVINRFSGVKTSTAARKAFDPLTQRPLTGIGAAPALDREGNRRNISPIIDVLR